MTYSEPESDFSFAINLVSDFDYPSECVSDTDSESDSSLAVRHLCFLYFIFVFL